MQELIKITTNEQGIQVIDSRLVANGLGIQHKNLIETIRKYKSQIESDFGAVAFETEPRQSGNQGGDKPVIAHLTEDQCIFIATLSRNTNQVVAFKISLVKAFAEARNSKIPPQTAGQMLLMMAQSFAQLESRQLETENRLKELEARQQTIDTNFYTVAGFASLKGIKVDTNKANLLGRACVKLSKNLDYPIGKMYDGKYGNVNSYHIEVLQEIFEAHQLTF